MDRYAIITLLAATALLRRIFIFFREKYLLKKIYQGDITKAAKRYKNLYKKIHTLPIFNARKEDQQAVEQMIGDSGEWPELPLAVIREEIARIKKRSLRRRYNTLAEYNVSYVTAFVKRERSGNSQSYLFRKYIPFDDLIIDGGMTESFVSELMERNIVFFELAGIHSYLSYEILLLIPYERPSNPAPSEGVPIIDRDLVVI